MRNLLLPRSARLLAAAGLLVGATSAHGQVRITEWAYSAGDGEFVELTNVGPGPADLAGWSYDDDSRTPGVFPLGGFGTVGPGQSVIFTESGADAFRTAWSLDATVGVLGGVSNNLGRNDEINIFDGAGALVDRLTFGDQSFPGTIRTQDVSGNTDPSNYGANNVAGWFFSTVGDDLGSIRSVGGDVGNPGVAVVPEPASLAVVAAGALLALRRRRA